MAARSFPPPLASTLITGERDAVLVDAPYTHEQIRQVGDWVEASGKNLIAIYATHGHGDHWFGTAALLKRFPDAIAYASEGTIALMHKQLQGRARCGTQTSPVSFPPVRLSTSRSRRGVDLGGPAAGLGRSDIPTPTTPPCCTCPRSVWSSPATPSTTAYTRCCWKHRVAAWKRG